MYKPPENTNRVKAIKSKFENNENINIQVSSVTKNKKIPPTLSRQLSDPIKVNIKRSPAFRNDKQFQRNGTQVSCRTKSNENKSLTDKTCDNKSASPQKKSVTITKSQLACSATNFSNLRKRFDSQENLSQLNHPQALRERCNTSAEIILNKEKMRQKLSDCKKIEIEENLNKTLHKTSVKNLDIPKGNQELKYENICMLYTEPIPKAQRAKENNLNDIHNSNTLTIEEKNSVSRVISDSANLNKDPVSTNVGHAKCHDDIINYKLNALTDTLKLALKKPLPNGPAPKKPPRTFTHSPQSKLQLKSDFEKKLKLNLQKDIDLRKKSRADPKYMLDKLENALKNNKIRLKKDTKLDYTSEEDNCESPRKSQTKSSGPNSKFNFNCLQSLSCSNATYERMSTQKSPAVSNARKEEPVYAEPFVFPQSEGQLNLKTRLDSKKSNRNSLYYMSTPVISTNEGCISDDMEDHGLSHSDAGEETSSLSTPTTSDIDSITSTPSEESKKFSSSKIKDLIKTFEQPNMDNRVDNLGKQLRQTLERSFFASGDTNDSENCAERSSNEGETSDAMVGEFETYVRTIRLFARQRRKCDGKNLFYCCLLVGLNGRAPYIKFQFPQKVELPHKIEELCFPDSVDSIIDCSVKAQNYSIVLTNHTGERIYGYCRRVLPENSTTCLPLAYCILSKQRAPRFYRRILEELESRHGIPDKIRDILWNEFYYHRFPMPGETIRINLVEVNKFLSDVTLLDDKRCDTNGLISNQNGNSKNGSDNFTSYVLCNGRGVYGTLNKKSDNKRNGMLFSNDMIPKDLMEENEITSLSTPTELIITLHQDSRYKENDLEELCNTLKSDILQKVFASLLLERKVVFISTLLGKLSTCIEAIQNMLYPFSWPHTLIPVIPKDLWEIVEAPTPLICGALSLSVVYDYVIEYGIVVNLDKGEILKEVGDEGKIIPGALVKEFKDGMSLAHSSSGENENAFNVLLSDAFLRIFISSCGHYKDFIKDGNFQKEEFMQFPKSKSIRRFLRWFTETTMFCTFIDTILADASSFTIFDKRIQIYSSPDANLILGKMKDWKKEKTNTFF